MIEYIEIVNKIKEVKDCAIDNFNNKVCIPLALSNLDSGIKKTDEKIVIEKKDILVEIDLDTRESFSEIIYILENLDKKLYNKIDYKYIDFFEKFKSVNYFIDINQEFEIMVLKEFSLDILAMFNLKFWCQNDIERKNFLENMKPHIKNIEKKELNQIDEVKKLEEKDELEIQEILPEEFENLDMIKNTWWTNLLNKIRNFKKKI